jgi:cation:H+ antiporter
LIGLTVVAFGTSSPEFFVSIQAAWQGRPDLALGNVVGSNIANILLILGLAALVRPLSCRPRLAFFDGSIMVAAGLALAGLAWLGRIPRAGGVLFLAALAASVVYSYLREKRETGTPGGDDNPTSPPRAETGLFLRGTGLTVLGLAALAGGSSLLIEGALSLALEFDLSPAVIGLSVVAVGTSLPELATSVIAAYRGQPEIAVSNIIGSNIFNILGIVGSAALVKPLVFGPQIAGLSLWVMLASALVLVPFLRTGWRLSRLEGCLFLAGYAAYAWSIYS